MDDRDLRHPDDTSWWLAACMLLSVGLGVACVLLVIWVLVEVGLWLSRH